VRAAEAIGRASLSHRVLLSGAALDDAARHRLAAEGVTFLDDGQPDPRQRVNWDSLALRVASTQERRRSMRTAALNYLQIPAMDLEESIAFYEEVLGWKITRHPSVGAVLDQTGYPEFVDSTGHVGGGFVLGRPPSREPGLMPVIAVDSIADVLTAAVAHGGQIVKPRTPIVAGEDWEATFRDPAGNAFGLYEHHGS
jgi:predicted enzyme related to lactoylglutathione lyase